MLLQNILALIIKYREALLTRQYAGNKVEIRGHFFISSSSQSHINEKRVRIDTEFTN